MGTNFYLATKCKETRDNFFGYNYSLTDTPDWGYEIHIAKTSCGWLPLFQKHDCISSVKDIENLYATGKFIIYDECGTIYDWLGFKERVLDFNGGIKGVVKRKLEKIDGYAEYIPISHPEYQNGRYRSEYFKDPQGYEFTCHEFR